MMQVPANYKTEYGLYRATMHVLDGKQDGTLNAMRAAWWIQNARYTCQERFPELLPQLNELINSYAPRTLDDLKQTF